MILQQDASKMYWMMGELCVPNCPLPVLNVYILSELTQLKMQYCLTAHASGKENRFFLDIARSFSEWEGKCEKRSTKKKDRLIRWKVPESKKSILSTIGWSCHIESKWEKAEGKWTLLQCKTSLPFPRPVLLHKVLQIQQKPHTDPHHRLDEKHLSITRALPQLSGPCHS